ncbi:hypothetical protein, partial [uncultured Rothia sp.]|uniref:hypothetical protein n=1 Tax=uncultured Rothia sp. TaxID=316088 RepID=UPI002633DC9D
LLYKKFKNLQNTPKNLENALPEPPKRAEIALKTGKQRRPTRESCSQGVTESNDQQKAKIRRQKYRAPPDGGALSYIGNVYREQKRRGAPPPNIQYRTLSTKHSAEKHPSPSICIEKTKSALY